MAQIKIFGLRQTLEPIKHDLSDVIHSCIVEALSFPTDKRFHRFFLMDESDFYYAQDRSTRYLILEISMFEGRSVEVKKRLFNFLYQRIGAKFGIAANDLEITIFETPKHNWGIRGKPGDELALDYSVEI
jgi:hypothetical protein